MIGDPPNIMIGSQTHLGFIDFAVNLVPVVVIIHVATMAVFPCFIFWYFIFK